MEVLKIYKMHSDVFDLVRATEKSACWDIRAFLKFENRVFNAYTKYNAQINRIILQDKTEDPPYLILPPGERALIPTGLILDIPAGHNVRIHPRSGLSFKTGLTLSNCEGVIDEDYIEQLFVSMMNTSQKEVKIYHGDRIAQLEMIKTLPYSIDIITEKPKQKTNRSGGFGSTGV